MCVSARPLNRKPCRFRPQATQFSCGRDPRTSVRGRRQRRDLIGQTEKTAQREQVTEQREELHDRIVCASRKKGCPKWGDCPPALERQEIATSLRIRERRSMSAKDGDQSLDDEHVTSAHSAKQRRKAQKLDLATIPRRYRRRRCHRAHRGAPSDVGRHGVGERARADDFRTALRCERLR